MLYDKEKARILFDKWYAALKVAEEAKLELIRFTGPPIGTPVYVFDKWKRIGTVKDYRLFSDRAIVVLELRTKESLPYEYFVYDTDKIKLLK